MSNGAFPDPIHTLKECSLKYNTFTEMNFNRFDFSDGNEIVGSMFAKCEMQLANFKGVELHETEFYQCDLRKADFRDATGYKVDILGSRLKDAKFSLPEAVNLLGRFENQAVVRRRENASTHHCPKRSADVSR